jgi:hypothetical protein
VSAFNIQSALSALRGVSAIPLIGASLYLDTHYTQHGMSVFIIPSVSVIVSTTYTYNYTRTHSFIGKRVFAEGLTNRSYQGKIAL